MKVRKGLREIRMKSSPEHWAWLKKMSPKGTKKRNQEIRDWMFMCDMVEVEILKKKWNVE